MTSPDGDQGFPGEVSASATYIWTDDNRLITDFWAIADKPTPINLTLHGYWNLAGTGPDRGIHEHLLQLESAAYLPIDAANIPTAEIRPVAETAFDFRAPHQLGPHLVALVRERASDGGYDHCWVIDGSGLAPRRSCMIRVRAAS